MKVELDFACAVRVAITLGAHFVPAVTGLLACVCYILGKYTSQKQARGPRCQKSQTFLKPGWRNPVGKRRDAKKSENSLRKHGLKNGTTMKKKLRRAEREADRRQYEELIRGLMERRPRRVEVGPESLKLTKLGENDDIEAFLTTFERAVEAHGVERQMGSNFGSSADGEG